MDELRARVAETMRSLGDGAAIRYGSLYAVSAALAAELTPTTLTVTAFSTPVWSCILKGEIDVSASSAVADDGADMIPVLRVTASKAPGSPRWDGFIKAIGEDSILT